MEANPGTFEAERFTGFRDAGVTRLSLGVQSFDDARLATVGRVHDAAAARRALEHALGKLDRREHRDRGTIRKDVEPLAQQEP
jgi:oxygen-independent coproporphyrinogen-3 oxidase